MKKILIGLGIVGMSFLGSAQNKVVDKYGKGFSILGKDSTFFLKANTRIQCRYDYERIDNNSKENLLVQDAAFVRRTRIKFGGWAYSTKVKYKIEHDLLNGVTYDAVVKYNFFKGLEIWAGQTKLPGNRERVIYSQALQFVDRSLLNTVFTLDRDAGIQLRNKHKIGKMIIKEMFCISQGEGLNDKKKRPLGHEYTGRVEILPMGKFASKGDYVSSDLKREKKPKLAIGLTYDYNQNQSVSRKVKGSDLVEQRNFINFHADFMYKHRGLSILGEYANADVVNAAGEYIRYDSNGNFWQVGQGFNLQSGYLLKNNVELSGRYSTYIPFDNVTGFNRENQYTLGLSKYVVGHYLKVQTDITFIEETMGKSFSANDLIYRLQFEVAF
jgi:hypothetical protein